MNKLLTFLGTGVLAMGAMAGYAFLIEPRWLQVTHTRLALPHLPSGFRLRVAHLTDLHAGSTPFSIIRRACRKAAAARPDLIVLTGDFISDTGTSPPLEHLLCLLHEELAAPLGVYAVPGNHDHAAGIAAWHRTVQDEDTLIDLTNRATSFLYQKHRVWIAGVDDLREGTPRPDQALLSRDGDADLTIVLSHDPDLAEEACHALGPVDLVLSGHTHGGQVRLPLAGALYNPSHHDDLYAHGLTKRPWAYVYVSRGVGTVHLPVRFMCRPEVALIDLVGTSEAAVV